MTSAIRCRLFFSLGVAINLIAFLMARVAPRPPVGFGAALDCAVTVPVLYILLIVRGGLQPLISAVPVWLLGLLRASYLAPGASAARPAIGALVEVALAAPIVARARRGLQCDKRTGSTSDLLENLEASALAVVPSRRVAAVLGSELAVFYFAFAAWRRKPEVPAGARAFSIHEQSGAAALFGMLAGVGVMEAALVHLVVARFSQTAAWALTAVSVYGCIWLVAMARAVVLRPVLVTDQELVLRSGVMWLVRVPLKEIAGVERAGATSDLRIPDLRIPLASEANVVARFHQPIWARGMYGMVRSVRSLALAVDDRNGFERALNEGIREASK